MDDEGGRDEGPLAKNQPESVTSCDLIGIGKKDAYSNFLRGLSASGEFIKMEDYVERGRSLGAIFKTDLRN